MFFKKLQKKLRVKVLKLKGKSLTEWQNLKKNSSSRAIDPRFPSKLMLLKSLAKASNWRIFWTKISRFYIFPQVRTSLAWYLTARSTPTTLATLVGGGVAGGVEKRAKPVSQTCQKLRGEGGAGGQDQSRGQAEASDEGKFGLTQFKSTIPQIILYPAWKMRVI